MDRQKFLADFIDQEVYLLKGDKGVYTQIDEGSSEQANVQEKEITYSGSNSKGVLVIIQAEQSEEELTLLENILGSIGLSMNEIALVKSDNDFKEVASQLNKINSTKLISFGVSSVKSQLLDIQTKYSPTTIEGRTVIIADQLADLNADKELKRSLWTCLQEVFNS